MSIHAGREAGTQWRNGSGVAGKIKREARGDSDSIAYEIDNGVNDTVDRPHNDGPRAGTHGQGGNADNNDSGHGNLRWRIVLLYPASRRYGR